MTNSLREPADFMAHANSMSGVAVHLNLSPPITRDFTAE